MEGILPSVYCPVANPIPNVEFQNALQMELSAINSDAQVLRILPRDISTTCTEDSLFGPVPFGCPLSYQQKPIFQTRDIINHPDVHYPKFSLPNLTREFSTVLNKSEQNKFMGMHVTESICHDTEEQTRNQSNNKIWHDIRKMRITSSVFKDVCVRKADFQSLAARLLKTKNIMTAQMKFGIEHEPIAAKSYCEMTGNSVYLCGFVINPSAPHLGTSPDRKVFDSNANPQHGLLEIKCPSKDSFVECQYLLKNKNTGLYKLKPGHIYYYQVMGQMALTGITWCDFFVKCRQDFHMERITFNPEKWCTMKEALDTFYFEHLLPQICIN